MRWPIIFFLPCLLPGAITNTRVLGSTHVQAIITYTAPDAGGCTIEVSQAPAYSPLAHDVNNTLFPGANSDSRAGNLVVGRSRTFVVGQMRADLASDSKYYSRALENNKLHYFRITCGGDTATGQFRTRLVPWGDARNPGQINAESPGDGSYAWPTIPTGATDRNATYIDPTTGVQVRTGGTVDDNSAQGAGIAYFDGGHQYSCQPLVKTDSVGDAGFYCTVTHSSGANALYWISRDTGETRYLGRLRFVVDGKLRLHRPTSATWDDSVVGRFYGINLNLTSTTMVLYRCDHTGSVDASVSTPATDDAVVSCTDLEPNLSGKLETYTASHTTPYTFGTFNGPWAMGVQSGRYVLMRSRRGIQDTLANLSVYDLDTSQVIASAYTAEMGLGLCGEHATFPTHESEYWFFTPSTLTGNKIGAGPYITNVTGCDGATEGCDGANLTTCTVPCATRLTIDDDIPTSSYDPVEVTGFSLQAGQYIAMGGEFVRITVVHSPTSITVQRGIGPQPGSAPKAHTLPIDAWSWCWSKPADHGGGANNSAAWDYVNDPNGRNVAHVLNNIKSHRHVGTGYAVSSEGPWSVVGFSTHDQVLKNPGIWLDESPDFERQARDSPGNSYQSHPRHQGQTIDATPMWGLDARPMVADNDSDPDTVTLVSGTLYQITETGSFAPKYHTIRGICGAKLLQDVSSSALGDQITGDVSDHYKFCVAARDGECRTGSSTGDKFVNCPGDIGTKVSTAQGYCSNAAVGHAMEDDVCFGTTPPAGHAVVQFRFPGLGHGRHLRRLMMTPKYHTWTITATSRALPEGAADGSGRWATTEYNSPDGTMMLNYLVPPEGATDSIRRDQFVDIPVELATALEVDNVIVEFGYDESFQCTSRQEVCVAAANNDPYFWAHESYSGVGCSSGCTVVVPAISSRVLYYRTVYRNAGGGVVATGDTQVVAVP